MSYDNPITITYNFGSIDFAAGAAANAFKGPAGLVGRIVDIGVHVTEVFNAVTTAAFLRVGTTGDADAFAELNMGTAAATNYFNTQDDTDAIIAEALPADTQIEVAFIANTGGTPTGIGIPEITVEWF